MDDIFLKREYERLHSIGHYDGYFCTKYKKNIKELIDKTGSKSLLDYGSGKGFQYSKIRLDHYWRVAVTCYDKYVKELSTFPDLKFDGVICVEVLEHVPEDEVDIVLKRIFESAKKFVFLTIATKEAKKKFSNGENVHILLKDENWWMDKINSASKGQVLEIVFN